MTEVMSFDKFRSIMETLLAFQAQRDRISDFIEKEVADSSFCVCTLGSEVENALVCLLADHFNCWYSWKEKHEVYDWWTSKNHYDMENEIEAWLYGLNDEKKITIIKDGNEREIDVSSIEAFYDYLIEQYMS